MRSPSPGVLGHLRCLSAYKFGAVPLAARRLSALRSGYLHDVIWGGTESESKSRFEGEIPYLRFYRPLWLNKANMVHIRALVHNDVFRRL